LTKVQDPVIYSVETTIGTMTVRARHGIPALLSQIDTLWKQHFPNNVMHATPARAFFELQYADESRIAHALALAATIAFLIAAFGVYVLAAYTVRRRQREIVLRKLHGAYPRNIANLLMYEFGSLIGVSALLGIPLAWLAIERYLSQYHERAPFGVWPLALALLFAGVIALISTGRHTFAAMRVSPAQVLRV
jgi:putative ABC transport system permease protein